MNLNITKVPSVKGIAKPRGSYSVYTRTDNLLLCSGQVAVDPETGEIPASFAAQLKLVLNNLKIILEDAGSTLDHVLKTTVFLKDPIYRNEFDEIYKTFFKNGYPARSTVAVNLMHPDFLIELEAVALIPG